MQDRLLPREFGIGRLRRLHRTDLAAFQAYRALAELGRFQGWLPMSFAEALQFLDDMHRLPLFTRGEWVQIGIADGESGLLIGDIGVYLSEDGTCSEVGFTLAPAAQGRGIATVAVRETVQLLFAATGVSRVLGITDQRNLPSIRLLERVGFTFKERRSAVFRGEPCIEWVYELLRASQRGPDCT
jgi:RimJ/RimL family protein N-acetyltransferase